MFFRISRRLSLLVVLCTLLVACKESGETVFQKNIESDTLQESTSKRKAFSEQEMAILKSEVKESFASSQDIDISLLSEPFLFDLNNDGVEEVIMSSAGSEITQYPFFSLRTYDLNGNELSMLREETESRQTIYAIQNETYGNCIAIISYSMKDYAVNIVTVQSGELQSIGTVHASGFIELIGDINEDGFEEFAGLQDDVGIGSDRIPTAAGLADKVWYMWDVTKKEYLPQVTVGEGTKSIGPLDEELAKRIIHAARQTQLSWLESLSWEEVETKLSPLFSNNFLYEYKEDGHTFYDDLTDTYSPLFLYTEDPGGVLPDIGEDPLLLSVSEDGNTVTMTKELVENYEGIETVITVEITFVKTVKGWKIDVVDFL